MEGKTLERFFFNRNILLILTFFLISCSDDREVVIDRNQQLADALILASEGNGLDYYKLPTSQDYGSILQDPKNSLTNDKVELGKLLFHETGLGTNPKRPEGV